MTLLGLGTALSSVTRSDPAGLGLFGVLVLVKWTDLVRKRGERRRRYRKALSLQLPLNRLGVTFFHGRHLGHRHKLRPVWCDWKGQRAESVWEVLQPVAWVSIYQPTWAVSSAQVQIRLLNMSFLWLTCPTTSLHSLQCSLKCEQAKLCPSTPINCCTSKWPDGERSSRNAAWSNSLLIDQACSAQKCCLSPCSNYEPSLPSSRGPVWEDCSMWQHTRPWLSGCPSKSRLAVFVAFCAYRAPEITPSSTTRKAGACQKPNSAPWRCMWPSWAKQSCGFSGWMRVNQQQWIPRLPKH